MSQVYKDRTSCQTNQMIKYREIESKLLDAEVWRVFISGSSSAGKTHFAKNLLSHKFFDYDRIYYFHPDIAEDFPVNWTDLEKPVLFQAGLPTRKELLEIPPKTCIVLDDLYTEACKSDDISYLFRVLSSKKKLHLIIMTQRYFAERGLNIRNCSNFHVLMSNVDVRTNSRVAAIMGLNKEIKLADEMNRDKLYPYIFLDRTNSARVTGVQVFTDIFSRYKAVIFNRMKSYIISEADFKCHFKISDTNLAVKNENTKSIESDTTDWTSSEESDTQSEASTETDTSSLGSNYRSSKSLERYQQKRRHQRKSVPNLQRYKKRTKLQR